ncbi:MAG: APC family permease [Candidatus Acidiferrales bacterium]
MTQLARTLRTLDYFTLGFGTMVGVGWLVLMDDWLTRGGPLGAILGFVVGGAALLPIGYVYGRLVMALPDAASEVAYTGSVFSENVSFATGWMMMLAYLIVCPWEAVAIGKMAAYVFPALDTGQLYQVAGKPVYLPHLVLGLGLTAAITILNYRGIRSSATFQNWATFGLLGLFAVAAVQGVGRGAAQNFAPWFSHSGWVSVLLVLQVVPYYMTGFESVPKCAEEASPEFRTGGFFRAILLAIVIGILFYVAVIAVVAFLAPWPTLANSRFATAVAFERALGNRWGVNLLLGAALLSLVKIFNGNFIAASRLLFALGRRRLVDPRLGRVHETNRTPVVAIVAVGAFTAGAALLGESILVPISEVGALASAVGWLGACAAYARMDKRVSERCIAAAGLFVSSSIILIKLLPFVPGHFTVYEYVVLGLWCLAGLALRQRHQRAEVAG